MRNRITMLVVTGLFVMPSIVLAGGLEGIVPVFSAAVVQVPEYWGGAEWLGFFTLASIAFAMMIRLKVLKPRIRR